VPAALLLEEGLPPEALFGELLLAALQLRGLSIALVVKALLPHFRNAQLPHTPNQSIPMQKTVYQHGTMFAVKRYPPCSICNLTTNGALTRPVRIGRPSMDCAQGDRLLADRLDLQLKLAAPSLGAPLDKDDSHQPQPQLTKM